MSLDSRLGRLGASRGDASDGTADQLGAARTVRRALADAGRKAFEVAAITISPELARGDGEARAFARLALGPHGTSATVLVVPNDHAGQELAMVLRPGELGMVAAQDDDVPYAMVVERRADGRADPPDTPAR